MAPRDNFAVEAPRFWDTPEYGTQWASPSAPYRNTVQLQGVVGRGDVANKCTIQPLRGGQKIDFAVRHSSSHQSQKVPLTSTLTSRFSYQPKAAHLLLPVAFGGGQNTK